ncbi:MAG: hypothetical protein JO053_04750 [Acidobacteria bacterium]|nr:hypothetical protein [Acidobacteriota bacterium]
MRFSLTLSLILVLLSVGALHSQEPPKVTFTVKDQVRRLPQDYKSDVLAIAAFFGIVRASYQDLTVVKDSLAGEGDIFSETAEEFPKFAKFVRPLGELEKLPAAKRLVEIDKNAAALQRGLTPSEKWQFRVGMELGGTCGQIFVTQVGDEPAQPGKLNVAKVRSHLSAIRSLAAAPPRDFPHGLLTALTIFGRTPTSDLKTEKGLFDLLGKILGLIEVISPNASELKKDEPPKLIRH